MKAKDAFNGYFLFLLHFLEIVLKYLLLVYWLEYLNFQRNGLHYYLSIKGLCLLLIVPTLSAHFKNVLAFPSLHLIL